MNVPPCPPSEGVTTTAAAKEPFTDAVNVPDGLPTAPAVGPVIETAVAAGTASAYVLTVLRIRLVLDGE